MRSLALATSIATLVALVPLAAAGQDERGPRVRQPQTPGIEAESYEWNAADGPQPEALKLPGDITRGVALYRETCVACHLPSGVGVPDGSYPQLASQHASVVIKQISDILAGRRDNELMYPYARHLVDPQELADVALYISILPKPVENGQGPGAQLERGTELYQRDCAVCHGARGEGSASNLYPRVARQHYGYLLRQLSDIAAEKRRNAHPEMVSLVADYQEGDLGAIADYLSRLPLDEAEDRPE